MDAVELMETLLDGGHHQSIDDYSQIASQNQNDLQFAVELKHLINKKFAILPSTHPSFIYWFFLGGVFNVQFCSLMGKLGIRDIHAKFDQSVIRLAYIRTEPNLETTFLSFRTIRLTEQLPESQTSSEINTFTQNELAELAHKWNLDYYFFDQLVIDDKYFEIKEIFNEDLGENELVVVSKVQSPEHNREHLWAVCKNRLVDEMYRRPYQLHGKEEFTVISERNALEKEQLQLWISNLHSNDIDTVKAATTNILHKFYENYRIFRQVITIPPVKRDSFVGYLTGAFTFNYKKRFELQVSIYKFPVKQHAQLVILPMKKLNAKLDLNVPIIIDATIGAAPTGLARTLKGHGIAELIPSFNTDAKSAILAAVNFDFPESLQPIVIETLKINQGLLCKVLHIYNHIIERHLEINVAQDILNSELMHLFNRQIHDTKSSMIRAFMYGQLLAIRSKFSLARDVPNASGAIPHPLVHKEMIQKAIFEYVDPVLKQEVTTFLVFQESCLIAFNIGKEDDVHDITETFFSTSHNLFQLPESNNRINVVLHVNFILHTMHGNLVTICTVAVNDHSQEFKVHNGEVIYVADIDVAPLVNNLELKNFQYIVDHMSEPLYMGKKYLLDMQHLKMFMKGLLISHTTILTPVEKQMGSVIGILDDILPEQVQPDFLPIDLSPLPSTSIQNEVTVKNRIIFIKLAAVDTEISSSRSTQMNQVIISLIADYFLHLDSAQNEESKRPILSAILYDLTVTNPKDIISVAIWEPTVGIQALLPTLASLISTECTLYRSKRNVDGACQFKLDDLDQFIIRKGNSDNEQIRVDSDKFLEYLAVKGDKSIQILHYLGDLDIRESKFLGSKKTEAANLVNSAKFSTRLHKIAKLADTGSIILMGKDLVGQIWSKKYKDAAVTSSFIIGSMALGITSQMLRYKAINLGLMGKKIGSKLLHFTAPFFGKLASGYILYDLIQNIRKVKSDEDLNVAIPNIIVDSTFLIIDVVDIGIELAATFGQIAGTAANLFGPIGSIIGALVFVGVNLYTMYDRVKRLDEVVHLTKKEVIIESFRSFFGLEPEGYIERLIERKQRFDALTQKANDFIIKTNQFRRYIFPTQHHDGQKWVDDNDNSIDLSTKLPTHYLARDKPDMPPCVKLLCFNNVLNKEESAQRTIQSNMSNQNLPLVGILRLEELDDDTSYYCERSIGISNQNLMINRSVIDLRHGNDEAKGFQRSPNVFLIGNGVKNILGGFAQDAFVLFGNRTLGTIYGGHNHSSNTLDLSGFGANSTGLTINLAIPNQYVVNNGETLFVKDIKRLITRLDQNDHTTIGCTTENVLATGGRGFNHNFDTIIIPNTTCNYKVNFEIGNNVAIFNHALMGNFNYLIQTSKSRSIVILPQNSKAGHRFIFSQAITTLISIDSNLTAHKQRFQFPNYHVTIVNFDSNNCSYYFNDSVNIRFAYKPRATNSPPNIHGYITFRASAIQVIEIYSQVANRLHISLFAHSPTANVSVFISHSNKDFKLSSSFDKKFPNILHNDPKHITYIYGADSENVYVIETGKKKLTQISDAYLPEVYIIEAVSNFTRTITLQHLMDQLKNDLNCLLDLEISSNSDSLVLNLVIAANESHKLTILRVILKNAVSSRAYEKFHIIGKMPMEIVFDEENEKSYNLMPLPITLSKGDNFILLHPENVTKNQAYKISRNNVGDFNYFKNGNGSVILIEKPNNETNDDNVKGAFFVILMKFEENRSVYMTLQFIFINKVVRLARVEDKITNAPAINEEIRKHDLELIAEINKLKLA